MYFLIFLFFVDATPSTFETPSMHRAEIPSNANASMSDTRQNETASSTVPNVSLDNFLAKNTSEDNASFEKIMEESKLRIKEKFAWLFQAEDEQGKKQDQNLALPNCEEQVLNAIDDKPYNLDSWTYKSRNALMYVPNGVELSAKELIEGKGKKNRVIRHENTRFDGDPFNSVSCKAALNEAATEHANIKKQVGKIGADGKVEAATPKVQGYGFVATPSPAPGFV